MHIIENSITYPHQSVNRDDIQSGLREILSLEFHEAIDHIAIFWAWCAGERKEFRFFELVEGQTSASNGTKGILSCRRVLV